MSGKWVCSAHGHAWDQGQGCRYCEPKEETPVAQARPKPEPSGLIDLRTIYGSSVYQNLLFYRKRFPASVVGSVLHYTLGLEYSYMEVETRDGCVRCMIKHGSSIVWDKTSIVGDPLNPSEGDEDSIRREIVDYLLECHRNAGFC